MTEKPKLVALIVGKPEGKRYRRVHVMFNVTRISPACSDISISFDIGFKIRRKVLLLLLVLKNSQHLLFNLDNCLD